MGTQGVESQVTGNLWKWLVQSGEEVEAGQNLAVIESMKMEIFVESPTTGLVHSILKTEGELIKTGEYLLLLETQKKKDF
jgi:biotin carboxyl carrier protein